MERLEMHSKFLISAFVGVASLTALSLSAFAHHGGLVEWQIDVEGSVTGVATDFAFRFPHVVVYVDVEDANGEVEKWALNTRWTPTILRQHGWNRRSIEAGDTVSVTYHPHVTEPTVVSMMTIQVNGEELPLEF